MAEPGKVPKALSAGKSAPRKALVPLAKISSKQKGSGKMGRGSFWTRTLLLVLLAVVLAALVWLVFFRRIPPPRAVREDFAHKQTLAQHNQVYAGLPKYSGRDSQPEILYNRAYIVGYSESRENPLWVAFRLDRPASAMQGKRPSKFLVDQRTKSLVNPRDYNKCGFDRGHLAPSFGIGHCFGPEAQNETFLMSNISPQKPNLNRKAWERLERQEDDYADSIGPIWFFAGPAFDDRRQTLNEGEEIPDFFYKILISEKGDQIRFLPFLFPQDVQGNEQLGKFLVSIDEIEKLTKLDFFWSLSDPNEDRLEAFKPTHTW